jgi:hypothetical protein
MPSGLHRAEASLATNFVEATPTEHVSPSSVATRLRMVWAISAGRACRAEADDCSAHA